MKRGRKFSWAMVAVLLVAAIRAVAAPAYNVFELGAGSPVDVNSIGAVIGFDGTSAGPQPWIIVNEKRIYLPLPTEPVKQTYAMVTRVSEGGVVVGHISAKPVIWKPDSSGVYRVEWIPLPDGITGGLPTGVRDTDNGPQVLLNVGYPTFLTSPTMVYFSSSKPYLFDPVQGLVSLVDRYGLSYPVYVSDMTALGRILGSNGVILEPNGTVTPAPPARTLSWTGFFANRVNQKGDFIVTASLATADGHGEIARYSAESKTWFVIETYIGAMYPYSADGINNAGDALSSQYAGHMLTTADGQRLPLNGLLLDPGYALTSAPGGAMSDNGKIVSVARNPAGIWNVVRLDPVGAYPPPDAVAVTGVAHPATASQPWSAISLSWTASTTATAYIVERKGPSDADFVALTPASGTIQLKYDDTAISPLTYYIYQVKPIGLGGIGQASNQVTVQSPPPQDTTAPTASITSPANGTVVSGPVTVSATASDNVGLRGFEILYAPNQGSNTLCGRVYTDVRASDTLSCTWDPSYLPSGTTATLTAYAYDDLGNYVMKSISVTYQTPTGATPTAADTAAPRVTILEPANNATVRGLVTVRASAQDNVGVARMEVRDAAGVLLGRANGGSISVNWDTSNLSKRQTITVSAYDASGNVGTAKVTVRVTR